MTFLPVTVLSAIGANYFKDKRITAMLLLLMCALAVLDFFHTNCCGISTAITAQEYLGLNGFHNAHTDAMIIENPGPGYYWLKAIGFEITERIPDQPDPNRSYYQLWLHSNPNMADLPCPVIAYESGRFVFCRFEEEKP
jgi:hypothetical protein